MFIGIICRILGVLVLVGCLTQNTLAEETAKAMTLSEALRHVKLFSSLTNSEKDALETVATLKQGKAGEQIIQQSKLSGKMFIMLGGDAEIRIDDRPFVTLSGESLVGEIEFLDGCPATADVLLLQKGYYIELDNAALTKLMEKRPRLGYVLMREIAKIEAKRLRKTNTKKKAGE